MSNSGNGLGRLDVTWEQVFDFGMSAGQTEARYLAGYEARRDACLRAGSAGDAHLRIDGHQHIDAVFLAGYEWAVFDYEDANGVRGRKATGA